MSGEGGGGVCHAGWAGDGGDDYRDAMLPAAVAMVIIVVEKGLVMVEEVTVVVMTWRRWCW